MLYDKSHYRFSPLYLMLMRIVNLLLLLDTGPIAISTAFYTRVSCFTQLKRRKPGFNESYHGFRSFSKLLEEMEKLEMLALEHDKKSGGYIITSIL